MYTPVNTTVPKYEIFTQGVAWVLTKTLSDLAHHFNSMQLVVNALSIVDMVNLEPYKWRVVKGSILNLRQKILELLDLEYRRFLKLKISYPSQEIFTYKEYG